MIIENLNNVPEVDGSETSPPPAGDYTLRVSRLDETPSKAGSPMLTVEYRVVGGEHAGKMARDRFTFVQNDGKPNEFSKGLLKNLLRCIGLPPGGIDSSRMLGCTVDASLALESYTNKKGEQKFSAKPTSYRKSSGASAAQATIAAPAAPPLAQTNEEVPF